MDLFKLILSIIVCCLCCKCISNAQRLRNTQTKEQNTGGEKRFIDEPDSAISWTAWTTKQQCSVSCGANGFTEKVRTCSTGVKSDCESQGGRYWDVAVCNNGPCGTSWGAWTSPSPCSVTCGFGVHARFRNCSSGDNSDCTGKSYDLSVCEASTTCLVSTVATTVPTTITTPPPAVWSTWRDKISCSATCGAGFRERVRSCSSNRIDDCTGQYFDISTCKLKECVVDGFWAAWTAWSACSETCDVGSRWRSRPCDYPDPSNKGQDCVGENYQAIACTAGVCPIDATWGAWSDYSVCGATCDESVKSRTRPCQYSDLGPPGKACEGEGVETVKCQDAVCIGDGDWSAWSSWSDCTKTCNSGLKFRARVCVFPPGRPRGANCTGEIIDKTACNKFLCAVDGQLTSWSSWTQCTHTCNGGVQSHSRICVFDALAPHGAPCVGGTSGTRDCGQDPCPIDGTWTAWGGWVTCSTTCGGGTTSRNRICDYRGAPHGRPCIGDSRSTKTCKDNLCPVDAMWGLWSRYSTCSKTCGGGQRTRTRACTMDPVAPMGRNCTGLSQYSEECNINTCPVDGTLTSWQAWSICPVSCDGGTHSRQRQCTFAPGVPHGDDCVGMLHEEEMCSDSPCPTTTPATTTTTEATAEGHWSDWASWSVCTASCDTGTQLRSRVCTYPDHTLHGKYCPGSFNQTRDCNTDFCPVDGIWNQWSAYSRCSVSCENGTYTRNRTCEFDPRYPQGDACVGNGTEMDTCYTGSKCPVDGVWSSWETWATCSVTCGTGIQARVRTCDYPVGTPHGNNCTGSTGNQESQACGTDLCPVDGVLTPWSNWTMCTVTCGNGTQTRNRTCEFTSGVPRGNNCSGDLYNVHSCNTNLCPVDGVWTEWQTWSSCSVTCGGGESTRTRDCNYDKVAPHGDICAGSRKETQTCKPDKCPVDGHWSGWSAYTACSVSCGNGTHIRQHTCTFLDGYPHGNECSGAANETEECNDGVCPVDGMWTVWADWSSCTVSCGNGTMTRDRTCDFPAGVPHGENCTGALSDSNMCNTNLCPVDGVFGSWSNWTSCTVTCGGGTQARDRDCNFDAIAPHGQNCTGNFSQSQSCNDDNCPVDGMWGEWSNFTSCTATCGSGTQLRKRKCEYTPGSPHGNNCTGLDSESQPCSTELCPVDGKFSDWSAWSACTLSCGNGTQTHDRRCTYSDPAPHGAACTGEFKEPRPCNEEDCPIDGHWSDWSSYTSCSATCGGGTHTRDRTCVFHDPAPHGAQCFGNTTNIEDCKTEACPVDGHWASWDSWAACTATCGGGKELRGRICTYQTGVPRGNNCSGDVSEARDCNPDTCPVDGTLTAWVSWTSCSDTCGDGLQFRKRQCQFPSGVPHGNNCTENLSEQKDCNERVCPKDGEWANWKTWSSCSQSCDGGVQQRKRDCKFQPHVPQGDFCQGTSVDQRTCNNDTCPVDGVWSGWSDFSSCTKSCDNGTATRTRTCEFTPADAPHGITCPGAATDVKSCNVSECPQDAVWSSWVSWSTCSATCGDGTQARDRTCMWPSAVHGDNCTGDSSQTQNCSLALCSVDGTWSGWAAWTTCSTTCNIGVQTKTRTCQYDAVAPHGVPCPGKLKETNFCNQLNKCTVDGVWSAWTDWSTCSTTCGAGTVDRTRQCAFPIGAPHGDNCTGDALEQMPCNNTVCPVDGYWADWGTWSSCTATCGTADHHRSRLCEFNATAPQGDDCVGQANETAACTVDSCPVDGVWRSWQAWQSCSTSCGDGMKSRIRECYFPVSVPHGTDCSGEGTKNATCNDKDCPVDGQWATWKRWRPCSTTCGGGTRVRTRDCKFPPHVDQGDYCAGSSSEKSSCNDAACPTTIPITSPMATTTLASTVLPTTTPVPTTPVPATTVVTTTPVSATTVATTTVASTTVASTTVAPTTVAPTTVAPTTMAATTVATMTGPATDPVPKTTMATTTVATTIMAATTVSTTMKATKDVATQPPTTSIIDGVWSSWTNWTMCSTTCGAGTVDRTRQCDFPVGAPHGDNCTGDALEQMPCNNTVCPVDGNWGDWGTWSSCTATCGSADHHRSRACEFNATAPRGDDCVGQANETTACTVGSCPVDGIWRSWQTWQSCSTSCGDGMKSRIRECYFPVSVPHGTGCSGEGTNNATCNVQECPVGGQWSSWNRWHSCSATCGDGTRTRNRDCKFPPHVAQGDYCAGSTFEKSSCNDAACPTTIPITSPMATTTLASTVLPTTTSVPTTPVPATTVVTTTPVSATTVASTTVAPTTVAPTTMAATTVATMTGPATDPVPKTTMATTTVATTIMAATTVSTTMKATKDVATQPPTTSIKP